MAAKVAALDGLVKLPRGKALPTRIRLFAWGDNPTRAGLTVRIGATTLSRLPGLQDATGNDDVPGDFEHGSHKGHPNYKGEPVDLWAYGKIEVAEGDGVYFNVREEDYTELGRSHALNYKDVSPVVHTDEAGNLLWISSVALTRHGATPGAHFFSTDGTLDRACLLRVLSLADEATDRDINASLSALESAMKKESATQPGEAADPAAAALSVQQQAAAATPLDASAITAIVTTAVNAAVAPLSAELATLKGKTAEDERAQIVALAAQQGKKIPAFALSGDAALSNAQLRALVADLPAGAVPLSADGQPLPTAGGPAAMTDQQRAICKAMSVTPEQWAKYNEDGSPKGTAA